MSKIVLLRSASAAVLEQLIYSASQLALSIALARVLSPREFGIVSALLAIVALQQILHLSFVHEPLLISNGKLDRRSLHRASAATLGVSLLISFVLFQCKITLGSAILLTGYQSYWLVRSLWSAESRYTALVGAGLLICGAIFFLFWMMRPSSAEMSSAVIGFTLLALTMPLWARTRVPPAGEHGKFPGSLVIYGFNASLAQLGSWLMTGGALFALASSSTPEDAGYLKISLTLLLPMQYLLLALGYFLLPRLANLWRADAHARAIRYVLCFVGFAVLMSAFYGIIVAMCAHPVVGLVFGPNYQTLDLSSFFYLPVLLGSVMAMRAGFRATGNSRGLLGSSLVGLVFFFAAFWLSPQHLGYIRALDAMTLGFCGTAAAMALGLGYIFATATRSRAVYSEPVDC